MPNTTCSREVGDDEKEYCEEVGDFGYGTMKNDVMRYIVHIRHEAIIKITCKICIFFFFFLFFSWVYMSRLNDDNLGHVLEVLKATSLTHHRRY